jgi:L-alanine-DL-glutamate epimerase-like enolase superfamily enzyme
VTGWDTRKALNYVPKLFDKLRETYGFDHHLLHDGHHRYTPLEAAQLGKALEPYSLFWLEDCTRRKTRKRSGWCASTPPRRWPSAKSSTRSGTPGT